MNAKSTYRKVLNLKGILLLLLLITSSLWAAGVAGFFWHIEDNENNLWVQLIKDYNSKVKSANQSSRASLGMPTKEQIEAYAIHMDDKWPASDKQDATKRTDFTFFYPALLHKSRPDVVSVVANASFHTTGGLHLGNVMIYAMKRNAKGEWVSIEGDPEFNTLNKFPFNTSISVRPDGITEDDRQKIQMTDNRPALEVFKEYLLGDFFEGKYWKPTPH